MPGQSKVPGDDTERSFGVNQEIQEELEEASKNEGNSRRLPEGKKKNQTKNLSKQASAGGDSREAKDSLFFFFSGGLFGRSKGARC